jgi:hypothetical protein
MDKEKIKKITNAVEEVLENLERKETVEVLASILENWDLNFLANLVKAEYEPKINSQWLQEECTYDEGNEEAGHMTLRSIFEFVEDILNKADEERFFKLGKHYVRLETEEEMQEEGHSENVEWYTVDEEINLKNLVGFTVS